MRRSRLLLAGLLASLIAVSAIVGVPALAAGPIAEVEPNNSCATAQDLGSLSTTVAVSGELAGRDYGPATPDTPNVDYFRVGVSPGDYVTVQMSGASSGQGSLADPTFAIFLVGADGCVLDRVSDYGGLGLDAATTIVAAGDQLLIAATACCTDDFASGGYEAGSYTLEIAKLQPIDAIIGQIVDARSGEPISGQTPYGVAWADLLRCEDGGCTQINSAEIDSLGRFSFIHLTPYPAPGAGEPYGDYPRFLPLFTGDYQIQIRAPFYEPRSTEVFRVAPGQRVDLGSLAVTPTPRGLSVSGTLVDAVTGEPLSSSGEPFANAALVRCSDYGCFEIVAFAYPDSAGRFSIPREATSNGLVGGTYVLSYGANQYFGGTTEPFTIGDGDAIELGAIPVRPNPVRLLNAESCGFIPAGGDRCGYSLEVANGQAKAVTLQLWGSVSSFGFSEGMINTTFQPELAQRVRFAPGEKKRVTFTLNVPPTAPNGVLYCADVLVAADGRGFYFNPQARANVFCVVKQSNSFSVLSQDEARELMQRTRGVPANQRGRH